LLPGLPRLEVFMKKFSFLFLFGIVAFSSVTAFSAEKTQYVQYPSAGNLYFVRHYEVTNSITVTNSEQYMWSFLSVRVSLPALTTNVLTITRISDQSYEQYEGDLVRTNELGEVETNAYWGLTNEVSVLETNVLGTIGGTNETTIKLTGLDNEFFQYGDIITYSFSEEAGTKRITINATR
jgi:hypothetical protein